MIGVSVLLIALAFIVLVFYLVQTLNTAKASLEETSRTLNKMQEKLDQLSQEMLGVIENSNHITTDVKQKLASVNQLFESAKHTGEVVDQVTTSVKQVSASVARSVQENVDDALKNNKNRITDVLGWVSAGMMVWQKWKALKQNTTHLKKGEEHDG